MRHWRDSGLASIDVNASVNILAVAANNVFTRGCVILIKRFVRTKAVNDSCWPTANEVELSHRWRLSMGLRTAHPITVCENKHRRLILI